jgi:outer membrane protein assembly factor BamA
MPDHYWGVGYDEATNTTKGSDTTAYDRFWWQINPKVLWQFREDLFAGVNLDFNQTKASDMSAGVANDPYIQAQGTDNFNAGAGLIFMHDSRDVPVNAYSGWLLSGSATFYGSYLGSHNTYQIFEIDYRQYQQIVRPGSTLAWKVYSRTGSGDVPWPEMTQVGNPFNLRGYYWGHYRNVVGNYVLLEYRYKFMTNKQNRLRPYEGRKESRHGFVVWVGLGTIGSDWNVQWGNWMPNAGVGYRFEVQTRMNARIDFGVGKETYGIYFNFNEAF